MIDIQCQDNLMYLQGISNNSVDLIITSPPYNVKKEYEKNSLPISEYIDNQSRVISECVRVLKLTGSICWQVGNYVNKGEIYPLDILLYEVFKQHGLRLRNRIIWTFGHGLHCKKRLSGRYEVVLWFTKSDYYIFNLDSIRVPSKYPNKKHYKGPNKGELSGNPMGKNPSDVWGIPNVKHNHPEKTSHPCQFPELLVSRLVLALTNKGGVVLDPYIGSGTTAKVAIELGRSIYGCDINNGYIEIALQRMRT